MTRPRATGLECRPLKYNRREDVILFVTASAEILEEGILDTIELPLMLLTEQRLWCEPSIIWRKLMRRIFIVIIILLISSCASTKKNGEKEARPKTTVKVENRNWLDMDIFVLQSTQRIRLGKVTGLTEKVFTIPEYVLGAPTLRFVADPIGARGQSVTHDIAVIPGDQVVLYIN